jgi:ABC-2 type transport system permease protein/lipopolysaccharide transport system permease protein
MSPSFAKRAGADLRHGLARRWIWSAMAMQDIRLKYRGSLLGPFWTTLTTAVLVASMGFVYSLIFKIDVYEYLPYLTFGLIPWQFISTVIIEGCQSFIVAQPVMHQARMPLSVHVFRCVYRNLLVVAHNLIIVVVVLALFGFHCSHLPLVIPAALIVTFDAIWLCCVLGMVSARFRDVPPIVGSILQIVFFLTPVFWQPTALGAYRWIADLNPVYAAIDIVRAPLLGQSPEPLSWPVMLLTSVLGGAVSFWFFAKFRPRVAYWVS